MASMNEINRKTINNSSLQRISMANKLIASLTVNCFEDVCEEKAFDKYLLIADIDVFITLIENFTQLRENSYKRDKLLSLITDFFYKNDSLLNLFAITCKPSVNVIEDDITFSHLMTILVSFPELVSNVTQLNTCALFERNAYFTRVVRVIYSSIVKVYELIKAEMSCSLKFISLLLGRICFNGYSTIVYKHLLNQLTDNCCDDFIWRRIAYRLLVSQQKDEYIEVIIKTIFCLSPNYQNIAWIINNFVEINSKTKFLLTNKFLLINQFDSDLILINIFGYLSSISLAHFFDAYSNVLNAWSNSSALKYRSYSQHLYLSRALMIGAKFLKTIDFKSCEEKFRRLTMNGIEVHLKCSQNDFRNIGLTVGQTLMPLFIGERTKLDFEIESNDDIKHLIELYVNTDVESNMTNNQKSFTETNEATNIVELTDNKDSKSTILDSDDDDDLIPYDMSHDIPLEKAKKPIYLRDCMKGLLETDKPEWIQTCLECAETVIRSNSEFVPEIAVEFLQILLNLTDNFDILNFIALRLKSMIALCVYSPKSVSQYLASQFYEKNHSIRYRLDVLEILLSASQELSRNPNASQITTTVDIGDMSSSKQLLIAENHWQQIINKRIENKTKVFAHKTKIEDKNSYINKFAQFAGHFFFPLMRNLSAIDTSLDMIEENHYVLGRLLYTLGIILHNVSLTPISRQMGRELMCFIWTFRYHSELYIREAVIFDFCMIITSVPSTYLFQEMLQQLSEMQQWLKDIIGKEANSGCVQKASITLSVLSNLIDKQKFN